MAISDLFNGIEFGCNRLEFKFARFSVEQRLLKMNSKSKFWAFLVALWFIPVLVLINMTSVTQAQERRTLLDLLFGPKHTAPKMVPKNDNSPMRRKPLNKAQQKPKPAIAPMVVTPQLEKSATAKKILFLGDFVASAMSEGLNELYADNANYRVIKRTEGSSGLVRTDYYNWHDNISKIVSEEDADIIIFVIGANDRQSIKIDKQTLEFNSEDWDKTYQERVAYIVKDLETTQKPWLWVSLPSFGKLQLHQSAGRLNAYYNAAIGNTNGKFIDLWSGFVDDKGSFALSGYDMNGQTARLRTNDGIAFTPAGRQKLAFYVKAPIEEIFGMQPAPTVVDDGSDNTLDNAPNNALDSQKNEITEVSASTNKLPAKVIAPPKKVSHIPPMNLTDLPKTEAELIDTVQGNSYRPNNRGVNLEGQQGRADYFVTP